MPNDVQTFEFGEVTVRAWPSGWQTGPRYNGVYFGDVKGVRVILDHLNVQYVGDYRDSVHNAEKEIEPVIADAVANVADELAWWFNDPDEFTALILQDVDADNFDEKSEIIGKLRDAQPIAEALYRWLDESEFDQFEEWAEQL